MLLFSWPPKNALKQVPPTPAGRTVNVAKPEELIERPTLLAESVTVAGQAIWVGSCIVQVSPNWVSRGRQPSNSSLYSPFQVAVVVSSPVIVTFELTICPSSVAALAEVAGTATRPVIATVAVAVRASRRFPHPANILRRCTPVKSVVVKTRILSLSLRTVWPISVLRIAPVFVKVGEAGGCQAASRSSSAGG